MGAAPITYTVRRSVSKQHIGLIPKIRVRNMKRVILKFLLLGSLFVAFSRADMAHEKEGSSAENHSRSEYSIQNPAPLEGAIFTGRPSFSTGPSAVPVGRIQFEFGYTYTDRAGGRVGGQHTAPNTLIRFGIFDKMEFRLSSGGYIWRDPGKDGTDAVRIGAKITIRDQEGWVPKMAVQPSFKLPVGSASESNDVDPLVQLVAAWKLSERLSLLMNANIGSVTDDKDDTESMFAYSTYLGRSLTDELGVFVEYFGIFPGDDKGAHNVDMGATYLLTDNLQLDAAVGFGLNDTADDFSATAGFSFRL